jgi:hypothetical protein
MIVVAWTAERERESEETDDRKEKNLGRKAGFFAVFGHIFLHP